ncbi:MAG: hypothetical protein WBF79_05460 [Rhodococcus sp. (in: high G+C Gram-positive bacteria)]
MITDSFTEYVREAEKLVEGAPHVRTDLDLAEGYHYLAGSIEACIHMAWAHDKDYPYFAQSTGPYTKMGLDNPDTLYFHANIRDNEEYVVSGIRGSTTDLSFQILAGDYTPVHVPDSLTAFDDRSITVESDGRFELRFGPPRESPPSDYFALGPGSSMLVVREVYSDWDSEQRGTLRITRVGSDAGAPPADTIDLMSRRFAAAGKSLVSRITTFLAFPSWFYLNLPVNSMTEPRLTPGGLSTQFSSAGHYELSDDEVLVITVPRAPNSLAPYQGFQLGSMWYVSLDYINHQTSLTADQARVDPDGMIRLIVSERDPGMTNWIERTGHSRGYVQCRWQRVTSDLTESDGPTVRVIAFDDLPTEVPYYDEARIDSDEWAARILARKTAIASRMLA